MALYFYRAFSKEGKKVSGYIDAPSSARVKEQLTKQNLFPVSISVARNEIKQAWWRRIFSRGISTKEKILFTKQLAILLKSGVPLLQALELLVDQFTGQLRTILISVKDDIKEGSSFADALKKYPRIFSNIYVQLVRAGEASGKLEVILERLTTYLERRETIRKRIRAALAYPIMQLVVAALVVIVLLAYVVPQMAENFSSQKQTLPAPTQFLISLSHFLTSHYIIILVSLIIIILAFRYWRGTPSGARTLDMIKLKLPLVKYFSRIGAVVQFSQTLGILLEGGVNLAESLDIVCNIIDNRILADSLNEARDKIIKQGKIAQYLKQANVFPPIAIYLIRTGEETGQLDKMLLIVAENYETELEELTDGLSARIGPILLIVMAVIVGFIVLSIALPITQMSQLAGSM